MTTEVALVLAVLVVTIVLFVTEALRTDVVAMLVMLALPWLGLLEPADAFRGFSSGAVISIMAVIVMGHGLDRTGVTRRMARPLARIGRGSPRRLMLALLGSVGLLSAFIQNVGAAALFLPVTVRLRKKTTLRISQLMMPLGFAAILGGTLTMIGSSPLIVLNDLVVSQGERPFGLFAVTPIGLSLLVAGLLLFTVIGLRLLPDRKSALDDVTQRGDVLEAWPVEDNIEEVMVPDGSSVVGRTRREVNLIGRFGLHVVAIRELGKTIYAPATDTRFEAGQRLAILGKHDDIVRATEECGLRMRPRREGRRPLVQTEKTMYAEILIPPGSTVVGQTLRDVGPRRNYSVDPLALLSGGEAHRRDFFDQPLHAGDILLVHGHWKRIRALNEDERFVLLTEYEERVEDPGMGRRALVCFTAAVALALVGVALPVALLSGALAMILLRVMKIDEAYRAISWRTVFLLAGLIPLGLAMESTGAARYLAERLFNVIGGAPDLVVLFSIGGLATLFTLFMSNVATTVVLVPLVMGLGRLTDQDPRALALLVAVCAQNSFVLPTHQVNALLMAAGGYRNSDYLRVGSLMSVIFLGIAVLGIHVLF